MEWLPLSEYAKTLEVSTEALLKAIKSGRIPASAISYVNAPGRGGNGRNTFINKTEADPAWVATHNPNQRGTQKAKEAVKRIKAELEANGTLIPPTEQETDEQETDEKIKTTLAEAQRQERVAKAAIAHMQAMEMQGELIRKDIVYKNQFEVGQQLRNAIMAVPDKIVAEIEAANGNRTQIRKILTEALAASLEGLEDFYNK